MNRSPRTIGIALACLVFAMSALAQSGRTAAHGITAVPGIRVGHFTLPGGFSGCTVVLADGDGAVGGIAQRGGAPGTRETDLLDPTNLVERVNAIVLSGGSAFGLDTAQGVLKYLEERNVGFKTNAGVVPIVPAAILFDLGFGGNKLRPTADCGYKAAAAATGGAVGEGNIGAGAGATVGKIGGGRMPTKSGIGSASIALPGGLVIGALVAVNAVGDIIDPSTGSVVAGARDANGKLADARKVLRSGSQTTTPRPGQNTTIGVVATNAKLTKAQASRMALMADDGLARALFPSHTLGDGDTVFALATGGWNGTADVSAVGALAADVMAEAIVRAAAAAKSAAGLPSASDLGTVPARFK
jgi:L-aminopeptidase/D-esterase-like protein